MIAVVHQIESMELSLTCEFGNSQYRYANFTCTGKFRVKSFQFQSSLFKRSVEVFIFVLSVDLVLIRIYYINELCMKFHRNGGDFDPDFGFESGTEIFFNCIESKAGERNTWKIRCEDGEWIGRSYACGEEVF